MEVATTLGTYYYHLRQFIMAFSPLKSLSNCIVYTVIKLMSFIGIVLKNKSSIQIAGIIHMILLETVFPIDSVNT